MLRILGKVNPFSGHACVPDRIESRLLEPDLDRNDESLLPELWCSHERPG
jgi:hypothetical protein